MKKMNNYQAPVAEVIEINIESPVLNNSVEEYGGGFGPTSGFGS
jgi:hypothetical protein